MQTQLPPWMPLESSTGGQRRPAWPIPFLSPLGGTHPADTRGQGVSRVVRLCSAAIRAQQAPAEHWWDEKTDAGDPPYGLQK